jgi:hypothetical protein
MFVTINMTNTILDIIHRSVFYLKRKVSETELCLQISGGTYSVGLNR